MKVEKNPNITFTIGQAGQTEVGTEGQSCINYYSKTFKSVGYLDGNVAKSDYWGWCGGAPAAD